MAHSDDDYSGSKPGASEQQKGTAVIDARISNGMVRSVGNAIERQPGRAAEVLRAWMIQRH